MAESTGDVLRNFREKQGWSASKFAEYAEWSEKSQYIYEKEPGKFTSKHLRQMYKNFEKHKETAGLLEEGTGWYAKLEDALEREMMPNSQTTKTTKPRRKFPVLLVLFLLVIAVIAVVLLNGNSDIGSKISGIVPQKDLALGEFYRGNGFRVGLELVNIGSEIRFYLRVYNDRPDPLVLSTRFSNASLKDDLGNTFKNITTDLCTDDIETLTISPRSRWEIGCWDQLTFAGQVDPQARQLTFEFSELLGLKNLTWIIPVNQ